MALIRAAVFAAVILIAGSAVAGDLFPFTMPWDDGGDADVTNLSSWNDKPAGATGFVTVDGGHLKADGRRLRLLGVNIVFGSTAPAHDEADALARRLAPFGINIVRFHHMDSSPAPRGILQQDRLTLDPDMMDRVDYFISALKREGIYTDLNLHVGRSYPGMGDIWPGGPPYWKDVDLFYPPMIALQQDYARALLTHRNPYTGNRYVEEPAVAIVEINNEDGLLQQWGTGTFDGMTEPFRGEFGRQWRTWLKQRYADDRALRAAWGVRDEPPGAEMLSPGMASRASEAGWNLQTIGAAKASVATTLDGLALSLEAPGQKNWHIQLHQNRLAFIADRPYTLTLRLRADHPLTLGIQAMQAHAPWARLWSDTVTVGTEWREVTLVFAPTASDPVARLTLGRLGFETGRLEIARASLKPGGSVGLSPGESLDGGTLGMLDVSSRSGRTAAAHYDGPMATGENLFSHQDARNLIRHGGMRPDRDFLQFDCALSYGLVEYLRTLEMLEQNGWSTRRVVPHGGHQMSLNIAAGLHLGGNESYPDVFKPFCGFADGIEVKDGYVGLPDIPGVGFEAKSALFSAMRTVLD